MKIIIHDGRKWVLSLFLISFFGVPAISQEPPTCAEKLQTAQMLFEKGQVEEISGLLSGCLESGFNREESLQAYKLLIQTFIYDEKLAGADSAMLSFLKKNPEYSVSPTDHTSFVSLFNNFTSKVIIQFSFHGGLNMPFTFITTKESLFGVPGTKKYSSKAANFFGAIEAKYKLTDRLELNAEVGYSQLSFSNSEEISFASSDYSEVQRRLEIPFTATYDVLKLGKFRPYARLGLGPALNLSSYGVGGFFPEDKGNTYARSGENIKDLPRIFVDFFAQAGGGMKFKVREGYLFAELRSNFGIFNQAKERGYNSETDDKAFLFMSGEDRFHLNTLNFNLGYTRIFYKPVRRMEE